MGKKKAAIEAGANHRRTLWILLGLGAAALVAIGAWSLRPSPPGPAHPPPGEPDVILVTIDTLRADALGYAGNRNVQTPFLDRIAAEGIVFTNAHAHNVVTLPSHANILTGLYPYQHGIRDNAGFTLEPKYRTIASLLKERGYATGAFVGALPLDARYGLNQGFDVYDDHYAEAAAPTQFIVPERRAAEVLAAATRWYDSLPDQKKFLWIHLYDPHAPYSPPAPFEQPYRQNPYLGEVAATDEALGRFLDPILKRKNAFLIVTSDHGEALGDHGELTHGLFAYEATLKVPLLLHEPGRLTPAIEQRPAGHVDIVPTILERIGVRTPAALPGKSLLSLRESRDTYFEALSSSLNRGWAPLVGLIRDDHKYVDLPLPELYDLRSDLAEKNNLISEKRRVVAEMRAALAAAAPAGATHARDLRGEDRAKLLSLGYVTGTATKKSYDVGDDPKNLVELDSKMHRAVDSYQRGDLSRAVEIARGVVRERPDMAAGREMLSFLLQQAEQPQQAIAVLREAIQNGTANQGIHVRLGMILSETGRAKEAVEILTPFADKNDVEILNAYGIALSDLGREADAVRQFERVLQIDPTNGIAYQNLGIVALRSRNPDGAHQYLIKALQLDPRLPLALNTLGVIYAQSGKPGEAIEMWTKAVAIDPHLYDALFNLAVVAGQSRRWDIAEKALNRFVETAPPSRYRRDIEAAKQMLREIDRRRG